MEMRPGCDPAAGTSCAGLRERYQTEYTIHKAALPDYQ